MAGDENRKGIVTMYSNINFETELAPAPPWDQGKPVINGPDIYGASPGKDFLYMLPVVGKRPLHYSEKGLPEGLLLHAESGQISGKAMNQGEYLVRVTVENELGCATKNLTIVIRPNAIALTPVLGWCSWNCFRSEVTDDKIRGIADGMISSGLAARGYSYINIDSGWQSKTRGGKFNSIIPKDEFPDMEKLCDYIHSLGLKAGIYSAPYLVPWGTKGCGTTSGMLDTNFLFNAKYYGKYIGIHKHEQEDVNQWADWGFDYFKYDWNSDMIMAKRMADELRKSSRDFIYNVTTSVKFDDALQIRQLANMWRSNADTSPNWDSIQENGFMDKERISNQRWNLFIGPGHWFDLDMLAISDKSLPRNEAICAVTCWMIRPSAIMIDSELPEIDDFHQSLLCNEEVLAINQDRLGKPAISIYDVNQSWVVQLKPLHDGSYAVAYYNLTNTPALTPKIEWNKFGACDKLKVRDLWAKKDLGEFSNDFVVGVDSHCAKLYKIFFM